MFFLCKIVIINMMVISMEIELFEHNEKAFRKLKTFLNNNILASVDHATGTGKSFIALKYLYENRDKRILYLTPTYAIYDQLFDVHMKKLGIKKSDFEKFDNIIYPNLLKYDMEEIAKNYDLIIFDEYHRCGAKKWGKKIKELKQNIIDKYPEKRIIGLTATNIRYLDKERNMNTELFDGNCVSRLTLDEAMLNGLLPSPTYINTYTSCDSDIEKLRKRILNNIPYKLDRKEYLEILDDIKKINDYKTEADGEYDLPRENGKYIVFCSTIKDIKKNQEFIQSKFSSKKLTFYEVHSGHTKEKNAKELSRFRENEGSNAFIFVVDILNEGIHIDDIDGIFMMRKTTSPIIFFQQLGRLLSFSGQNRKLIVWDLVDNLKNHPVIYNLVDNVTKLAKERIISDPKNKERYEGILENFKIIDHTANTLSKIDNLEKLLDNLDFIQIRVDRMVKILKDSNYSDKEEWLTAYEDLFKYFKYLNVDQFRDVSKLSIYKPKEIDCSEEEFLDKLNGFKTLKEKENYDLSIIIDEFEAFVNKNNRVPTILSDEVNERELAIKITEIISLMTKEMLERYNKIYQKIKKVSPFDRAFYGKKVSHLQYNDILIGCKICHEKSFYINRILKSFLRMVAKSYKDSEFAKYAELLDLSPFVNSLRVNNRKLNKIEEEKQKIEKEKFKDDNQQIDNFDDLQECYIELIDFIIENLRYPKISDGNIYLKYSKLKNLLIKYDYKESLDYILKVQKSEFIKKSRSDLFGEIVQFMHNNFGDLPSDRVDDTTEKELAKKLKKEISKFTEEEKEFLKNLKRELQANDNLLQDYLNFIINNKRFPIKKVSTYEEHQLHLRFLRNEPFFSKEEMRLIKETKRKLKEETLIRNTYLERNKLIKIFEKREFIKRVIEFIKSNYGDMPNINSIIDEEKQLALDLKSKLKELSETEINEIMDVQQEIKEKYNFNVVEEYINFLISNERYPLKTSDDDFEKSVAIMYDRYFNLLAVEDIQKINEVMEKLNKNTLYENTYVKNKRK